MNSNGESAVRLASIANSPPPVRMSDVPPPAAGSRAIRAIPSLIALLVGVVFAFAAPAGLAAALGPAPYERVFVAYPGAVVAIATPILLSGAQLSLLISAGALVHLLFLQEGPPRRTRSLPQGFDLRVLRVAAPAWAFCSAALVVLEALDSEGAALARLAEPGALSYLWQANAAPKAWTVSFTAAMIVSFAAFFADRWTGLLLPLWAAVVAVLAPVVTGQVLVGPNHDFGVDAAAVQAVAVYGGFGALVVALLRVISRRSVSPMVLERMLRLWAVALPVVIASDLVIAWFKLAGGSLLASTTGWLILGGWCCLAVLLLSLIVTRAGLRRGGLQGGRVKILLSVSGVAVLCWIGIGVSMTRVPPPQYFVPTSIRQVLMGYEVPDAPSFATLFGQWRPNLLFLVIAAFAITVYLLAVLALRRRGDRWPLGRTVSWLLGWAVVVIATSSGFGKYSAPDFGVHMIVHMSLNMLAPGLLVLGGVVTLLLRATRSRRSGPTGVHDWTGRVLNWPFLRRLYNPLLVFIVFIGSYYGLYLTPLFGELMRFHWAHQLMNLHFLIIGYLYYSLIIGVDRPPRPLPHIGKLGYVLAAMPFHAFFGVILMTSPTIIAETFYRYLDLPWADLQAQQYLGGGVAWAGGEIPLMIVVVVLGVQWSRQDAREAKRKDRHIDTGRDDEYDVYNRVLHRLAERDAARPGPKPRAERNATDDQD